MSAPRFVEVTGGRFYCDNCGCSWVGTWHGPVEQMTCRWCDAPMAKGDISGADKEPENRPPRSCGRDICPPTNDCQICE